MVKIQMKLGAAAVVVEAETFMAAMKEIAPLSEATKKIIEAGYDPENFSPACRSNKDGNFFFELYSAKDDKILKFGQYQDGSGLFAKGVEDPWRPDGEYNQGGGGGYD